MTRKISLKQQRRKRQQRRNRTAHLRHIGVLSLIALSLAVAGAAIIYRTGTTPPASVAPEVALANVDGAPDAPVSIVEFGDFGCSSCRAWHTENQACQRSITVTRWLRNC